MALKEASRGAGADGHILQLFIAPLQLDAGDVGHAVAGVDYMDYQTAVPLRHATTVEDQGLNVAAGNIFFLIRQVLEPDEHAGDVAEELAGAVDFPSVDAGLGVVEIRPGANGHGQLFVNDAGGQKYVDAGVLGLFHGVPGCHQGDVSLPQGRRITA